jgi:CrcB protein
VNNLYQFFIIGVFAAFGAMLRYFFVLLWPLNFFIINGILVANIVGCFLMGVVLYLDSQYQIMSQVIRIGIVVGFLGSLTTFSSFGAQFFVFIEEKLFLKAFLHVSLTVFLSLVSIYLGYWLMSLLFSRFFS